MNWVGKPDEGRKPVLFLCENFVVSPVFKISLTSEFDTTDLEFVDRKTR